MEASLLVELLTEELPPKSLAQLSQAFADEVFNGLVQHQLKLRDFSGRQVFATPRRLATLIPKVLVRASDRQNAVTGPSVKAPPEAVAGFTKKHGIDVKALEQRDTPKGKVFLANVTVKGVTLDAVLANIVGEALKKLPVPKVMRWGVGEAQFVRPVHGLTMLHGSKVVLGNVLGLESGSHTRGHRFMGKSEIALANADEYEKRLRDEGMVIADFAMRRNEIEKLLGEKAEEQRAGLGDYQSLLDEVTALVEHPSVYLGEFDKAFLEVPQECLILTMRQNQRYFPLFDSAGKLLPKFLIVSNMRLADARNIIDGNQRVVRPRLEDARFFFDQDRKQRLEERVPQLARVVYHNKLGSQLERVQRLQLLAGKIARDLKADAALAERAAWLAKADLLTGMVGEFPELQGVMGRYYALHDKEPGVVADAIETHYRPRFAGDRLPQGALACAVALADKLDTLAGLFSIGEQPTGDKDPFGLRRAALGVVRILVENELALSLSDLLHAAFEPFKSRKPQELQEFIYERFASYLKDQGFSTLQVDAVLSKGPVQLGLVPQQLKAVKAFQELPEAESLASANKRVANILRQATSKGDSYTHARRQELKETEEIALFDALETTANAANKLLEQGNYTGFLKTFAGIRPQVDAFFDKVMVMTEDKRLRKNRLGLLNDLREGMNRFADISKLAA